MPSRELLKNMPQISACRAGINGLVMDQRNLADVPSCHAATALRSAISVAIASRTAGRACMRAR